MLPRSFGTTLLRALDRWERLWSKAISQLSHEPQSQIGVARFASEFASISRRIIEVDSAAEGKYSRYMHCEATYDFGAFHDFILQHSEPINAKPSGAIY